MWVGNTPNEPAAGYFIFGDEQHMEHPFTVQQVEKCTVVEFLQASLMDPVELEQIGRSLYALVDEQDKRVLVIDFEKVQYLSSQAIGILLTLNKKLSQLPHSKMILCGVGVRLMELLKITRLDRILVLKPTQKEAVKSVA